MPTAVHLERDESLPRPGETTPDDTGLHDLGDLWLDLGGSD